MTAVNHRDILHNTPSGTSIEMSAPKVLSRKTNGVAGSSATEARKAPRVKSPLEGEKVVVRRLPPGMTEEEFIAILGDEWKVGNGKVGWVSYYPGKVSQQ